MNRTFHWLMTASLACLPAVCGFAQTPRTVNVACAGIPLQTIALPVIPQQRVVISEFGAVGDGHTLNTAAIQQAIHHCAQQGGGQVVMPPGIWLTGPLQMESRIELHLEAGALLLFSSDHSLYPVIKVPARGLGVAPPLHGFDLEDVAITGKGVIDGAGESWRPVKKFKTTSNQWKALLRSGGVVDEKGSMWWPSQEALAGEAYLKNLAAEKKKNEIVAGDYLPARDYLRPYMILLIDCKRVLVEGVTIRNSPKFALCPFWCEEVVIRDVQVNNEWWAQNGDGIDVSACKNVLIEGCTVTAGDDAICMKSSRRSGRSGAALRNIVVRDCIVYHGHGGFVVGSNTDGGMTDIAVENCTFIGTDIGLRFKSARDRGGVVENIHIRNIFMREIVHEAIFFDAFYESDPADTVLRPVSAETPVFRNIVMEHVYCVGAERAVFMRGLPERAVEKIEIINGAFSARQGVELERAREISFANVRIHPKQGPVFLLKQCEDIRLEAVTYPDDRAAWLQTSGMPSDAVKIVNVHTIER